MAVKCSHGFYYAFGCNDCTNAYNTREQAEADLREREADALSVLRDLVAGADDHRCWYIPDEIAGRIRALVAQHPTNKETT